MASTPTSADPHCAENWFVSTDEAITFELSLNELTDAIEDGRVPLSALVWRSGMRGWVALNEVPLLQLLIARIDPSRLPLPLHLRQAEAAAAKALGSSQREPSQLDDDDLTVVTAVPPMDLDDDDLTVVTDPQREPDSHPDAEGGVDLHASGPNPLTKPPAQSVRPVLVRPVVALPITHEVPEEAHLRETRRPSLSNRAPPKPTSAASVAESVRAKPAFPVSTVSATSAIPKLEAPSSASLLALAGRSPTLTQPREVTPVVRPIAARSAQQAIPSLPPPVLPARTSPPPLGNRRPAFAPTSASLITSTPPVTAPALAPTQIAPPIIEAPQSAVDPTSSERIVAAATEAVSRTPLATAAPANPAPENPVIGAFSPRVFESKEPYGLANPAAKTAPMFEQQETFSTPESLAPSVSGIMSALRSSRRPFYVAAAALVAVGTVALGFVGSATKVKSRTVASAVALKRPEPAVFKDERPPTANATHPDLESATEILSDKTTIAADATVKKTAAARAPAATPTKVASTALPRQHSEPKSAETATPIAKRVRTAGKSADSEAPAPANTAKKADPSSVASWDQGTVEQRSWMSPGF